MDIDLQVRLAAFSWLSEQVNLFGEAVLPGKLLEQDFEFQGRRTPLLGLQGIFKPHILELILSLQYSQKVPLMMRGKPIITNGIALCKLHHSAFDSFILGQTR